MKRMSKRVSTKRCFLFSLLVYVSFILGGIQPKAAELSRLQTKPRHITTSSVDLDGDGITDSVQPESFGLHENILHGFQGRKCDLQFADA